MRSSLAYGLLFIFIGLLCQDCNDPALFGSDLLKDDEINLKYVDSFSIEAQTLLDTGFITFDSRTRFLSKMPIGNFKDPIFGTTDARIFVQFSQSVFSPRPDFMGATLDSAMLYLSLDSVTAAYGRPNQLQDLQVFNMRQSIAFSTRYNAGQSNFENDPTVLGQLTGINPDPKKKIQVIEPTDTFEYDPHVAFRMSKDYGNKVMAFDSLWYNSDSIFFANVRGFMFSQANQNNRMMTFEINSNFSRLNLNYTKGGTSSQYFFPLRTGPRIPIWTHGHTMLIQDALNSKVKGNEHIYLQSLGGLKAKLEFPNLKFITGAIINKAELEFTVIELPQDDLSTYTPPVQLALYRRDTVNNLDVMISDQGGLNDFALLGGRLATKEVKGIKVSYYILNISNHLQRLISGKEKNEVYLAIAPATAFQETVLFPIAPNLSRVILGGPKHPLYPMKLKISFTTY